MDSYMPKDLDKKEKHPLSRYLIEKVYTWDKHFGPLTNKDYSYVAKEVNDFLLELKKKSEENKKKMI